MIMSKRFFGLFLLVFIMAVFLFTGANPALASTLSNKIEITAPSAGESLTVGGDYTIEFQYDFLPLSMGLYYSADGGTHWTLIEDSLGLGTVSYEWTVPDTPTSDAKLKLEISTFESNGYLPTTAYYYNVSEEFSITKLITIPIKPIDPIILWPDAPTDLEADAVSTSAIDLCWTDNAGNESSYIVERKKSGDSTFTEIAALTADTEEYADTGLVAGTTYYYRVYASNTFGDSSFSNEDSAKTLIALLPLYPAAPEDLDADTLSSSKIKIEWTDVSANETGYKIERKKSSGSFLEIATLGENTDKYTDTGLNADTTYSYRVRAYNSFGDSDYSNTASATTEPEVVTDTTTIMRFYIDNGDYYVNNQINTMDTAPIIKDDRTILPIRYVAEPLGADVAWDASDKKVTITMGSKIIKLWVDNNTANINGTNVFIDPNNANVKPIIIPPGRTMLPLRFIAESLGCEVDWDAALRQVTVIYTK